MDTWHHLRGLSEAFSPRNLEKMQISHDCAKWKIHQHHFRLPGAFRMTVRNFRMVMQNQFSLFPFELQPKSFLFHFIWLCKFFACSCEMEKHSFFNSFLSFLPFLSFDSTSTTSKSTLNPNPNWLHCFFHYAFGSSSTLFVLFNLIHLFCYQFIKIIPWNNSKTS